MTTANEIVAKITKTLEGVTPGDWNVDTDFCFGTKPRIYSEGEDSKLICEFGNAEDPVIAQKEWEANAAYADATKPKNIRILLSALSDAEERAFEAEEIIKERDDRLALVDRIADLIGLPQDQELDQVAFEIWFSKSRSIVASQASLLDEARRVVTQLTPRHHAHGCWCDLSRDIAGYGHEPKCSDARAFLTKLEASSNAEA